MAEEQNVIVVEGPTAASIAPSDHKRKLEPVAPEPNDSIVFETVDSNVEKENTDVDAAAAAAAAADVSGESEAKRPRLDDTAEDGGAVSQNGFKTQKEEEAKEENGIQQPTLENEQVENAEDTQKEDQEIIENEVPVTDNNVTCDAEQEPSLENPELAQTGKTLGEEITKPEIPQQEDRSDAGQELTNDTESISRKMDVPNNKVGVLIGKAGDTIRMLQYNSGAKIQIMRDLDADPYAPTRPLELTGSLENINKAEKLIKDVIAEADAGGSPSLVARGFAIAPAAGAVEQVQIQVPNEKVGLIIGRGGETIKSLQTRSGARIQLIPQHLPEGDQSKERTVRVSGDAKQIELARELITEVMNQNVRPSSFSSSYNQQSHRARGPSGHSQWGPHGPHPTQSAYNHQRRGPYPSHGSQYPPHTYNEYPPQQQAPRGGYGSNWEHRPSGNMQGPQGGGYDYYGGPAPHSSSMPSHGPNPSSAPSMGPPHSQANYNYGHQPAPYSSQTAPPPQQSYGHGYDGGHGAAQAGYGQQQQYGKPQSYSSPSQGHPPQSYGPPRSNQPGEYQVPVPSTQSYGQNVPPQQQQYPYASGGPMQQSYPTAYGSQQPAAEGYSQQPPPASSGPGYAQPGVQPGQGYAQPVGQQGPNYAQGGATGGYGAYPSSQPGYSDQQAPNNNAVYGGYQGTADPGYAQAQGPAYGAPQNAQQPAYAQVPQAQTGYEQQQVPQSGGYGSVPTPGSAPVVAYGKSVSPNPGYPPQYDATGQIYGAPR